MCNPRRIRVTATRQLDEAWEREVSRTVELRERVIGEARVRQQLDASLGGPTLRALEAALAAEDSGWTEVDEGYRFTVEGGYVTYLFDERALEIVAVLEDEMQALGEETQVLEGAVRTEISAEGEGRYYDDGWRGHTLEDGRKKAQAAAERELDSIARALVEQAANEAAVQAAAEIEAAARAQAKTRLRQSATELSEQARQHLDTVGLRCRQAFHQVLAQAYRDAILAYARRHGAEKIQCTEGNDVVEIEFSLQR